MSKKAPVAPAEAPLSESEKLLAESLRPAVITADPAPSKSTDFFDSLNKQTERAIADRRKQAESVVEDVYDPIGKSPNALKLLAWLRENPAALLAILQLWHIDARPEPPFVFEALIELADQMGNSPLRVQAQQRQEQRDTLRRMQEQRGLSVILE